MANIGEEQEPAIFEPFPEEYPIEEPIPAAEPAREEPVPAGR